MAPEWGGVVTEIGVKPNLPIKKGDMLFRLDTEPWENDMESYGAQVVTAQTSAAQLPLQLEAAKAAVANGVGESAGALEMATSGTEYDIEQCIFRRNRATGSGAVGGAITLVGGAALRSCAFLGNRSAGNGGAIAIAAPSTKTSPHVVYGCTFRGNTAAGDGGAVWAAGTALAPGLTRAICSSVRWENAALGGSHDQIGEEAPGNLWVTSSDVQGGWSGQGSANLAADPLFVRPFDFHLASGSPVSDLASDFDCIIVSLDADAQELDCATSGADLGADEVLPVTYVLGASHAPTVVVAGLQPGVAVTLVLGLELAEPPLVTPLGELEVADDQPRRIPMPPADARGASWISLSTSGFAPGTTLVLQGLAGGSLTPATTLLLE